MMMMSGRLGHDDAVATAVLGLRRSSSSSSSSSGAPLLRRSPFGARPPRPSVAAPPRARATAPQYAHRGAQTAFSDGFPLLLASEVRSMTCHDMA